jgi:hypothetical protein
VCALQRFLLSIAIADGGTRADFVELIQLFQEVVELEEVVTFGVDAGS